MRKLDPSRQAQRFLSKVPAKHGRQLGEKITSLLADPRPQDAKQLAGHEGLWRADCGEYRLIYRFDADTLHLALIGKRNDSQIYRLLRRVSP